MGRFAARGGAARRTYTFAMVTNAAALQAITEGPDGTAGRLEHGQDRSST